MYTIQSYTTKHKRDVKELGYDSFEEKSIFLDALTKADSQSLVLLHNKTIIGFALISFGKYANGLPKGTEIAYIALSEDYQGQGLGSMMIKYIQKQFSGPIWLQVAYSNPDAQRLYKRCGFQIWRRIGTKMDGGFLMGYKETPWAGRLRATNGQN